MFQKRQASGAGAQGVQAASDVDSVESSLLSDLKGMQLTPLGPLEEEIIAAEVVRQKAKRDLDAAQAALLRNSRVSGDRLVVGSAGEVHVAWGDGHRGIVRSGSVLSIPAASSLPAEGASDGPLQVRLDQGLASFALVPTSGDLTRFIVTLPRSRLAVKGTIFQTRVEDHTSWVAVKKGVVEVHHQDTSTRLKAGGTLWLPPGAGPHAIDLQQGLVAHWPISKKDDISMIHDASEHGHHLKPNRQPQIQTALDESDYWNLNTDSAILKTEGPENATSEPELSDQIMDSVSVSLRLRCDDARYNGRLISAGGGPKDRGWELSVHPGPMLVWSIRDIEGNDFEVTAPLEYDTWHGVCAVFTSGQRLQLFVDGHLAAEEPVSLEASARPPGWPVVVGERWLERRPSKQRKLQWTPFIGAIDDIRLYNRSLVPEEAAILSGWRSSP